MRTVVLVLIALLSVASLVASQKQQQQQLYRPLVLMHGLLATAPAMSHIEEQAKKDYPGIYTHNIEIVNGKNKLDSLFIPMEEQLQLMHKKLWADSTLRQYGFDLVGHSQGGLLTRAYVQRYGHLWGNGTAGGIHNYISLAGVQAGQYGVPDLCVLANEICTLLDNLVNKLMNGGATVELQRLFTFASYWRDPNAEPRYLQDNIFLADTLNQRPVKNMTYASNMKNLNKVFLLLAMKDHIVVPKQSEHLAFFADGNATVVTPWNETALYRGDWIGTRSLNEAGRLFTPSVECTHQDMPRAVCFPVVYEPWVKPNIGGRL